MDEGLVYTMKQVAAQLASQGSQEIAIYLKHLAAEIHHSWLQPNDRRGRSPISSPPPNGQIETPIDPGVAIANNLHADEKRTDVATPRSISSPPPNNQIEELLANLSSRFQKLEVSLSKHSTPHNPLWYMPILEQVDTHGWIISSEEVEQLIGIKPHCDSGHNFFIRGCWKFVKAGKIGTHSSWRVIKEIATLPSVGVGVTSAGSEASPRENLTPQPKETDLEPDLASPWTESN
jgi:hypothetical protein